MPLDRWLITQLVSDDESVRCSSLSSISFKLQGGLIHLTEIIHDEELLINLLKWFNRSIVPMESEVLSLILEISKVGRSYMKTLSNGAQHPQGSTELNAIGGLEFFQDFLQSGDRLQISKRTEDMIQAILSNLSSPDRSNYYIHDERRPMKIEESFSVEVTTDPFQIEPIITKMEERGSMHNVFYRMSIKMGLKDDILLREACLECSEYLSVSNTHFNYGSYILSMHSDIPQKLFSLMSASDRVLFSDSLDCIHLFGDNMTMAFIQSTSASGITHDGHTSFLSIDSLCNWLHIFYTELSSLLPRGRDSASNLLNAMRLWFPLIRMERLAVGCKGAEMYISSLSDIYKMMGEKGEYDEMYVSIVEFTSDLLHLWPPEEVCSQIPDGVVDELCRTILSESVHYCYPQIRANLLSYISPLVRDIRERLDRNQRTSRWITKCTDYRESVRQASDIRDMLDSIAYVHEPIYVIRYTIHLVCHLASSHVEEGVDLLSLLLRHRYADIRELIYVELMQRLSTKELRDMLCTQRMMKEITQMAMNDERTGLLARGLFVKLMEGYEWKMNQGSKEIILALQFQVGDITYGSALFASLHYLLESASVEEQILAHIRFLYHQQPWIRRIGRDKLREIFQRFRGSGLEWNTNEAFQCNDLHTKKSGSVPSMKESHFVELQNIFLTKTLQDDVRKTAVEQMARMITESRYHRLLYRNQVVDAIFIEIQSMRSVLSIPCVRMLRVTLEREEIVKRRGGGTGLDLADRLRNTRERLLTLMTYLPHTSQEIRCDLTAIFVLLSFDLRLYVPNPFEDVKDESMYVPMEANLHYQFHVEVRAVRVYGKIDSEPSKEDKDNVKILHSLEGFTVDQVLHSGEERREWDIIRCIHPSAQFDRMMRHQQKHTESSKRIRGMRDHCSTPHQQHVLVQSKHTRELFIKLMDGRVESREEMEEFSRFMSLVHHLSLSENREGSFSPGFDSKTCVMLVAELIRVMRQHDHSFQSSPQHPSLTRCVELKTLQALKQLLRRVYMSREHSTDLNEACFSCLQFLSNQKVDLSDAKMTRLKLDVTFSPSLILTFTEDDSGYHGRMMESLLFCIRSSPSLCAGVRDRSLFLATLWDVLFRGRHCLQTSALAIFRSMIDDMEESLFRTIASISGDIYRLLIREIENREESYLLETQLLLIRTIVVRENDIDCDGLWKLMIQRLKTLSTESEETILLIFEIMEITLFDGRNSKSIHRTKKPHRAVTTRILCKMSGTKTDSEARGEDYDRGIRRIILHIMFILRDETRSKVILPTVRLLSRMLSNMEERALQFINEPTVFDEEIYPANLLTQKVMDVLRQSEEGGDEDDTKSCLVSLCNLFAVSFKSQDYALEAGYIHVVIHRIGTYLSQIHAAYLHNLNHSKTLDMYFHYTSLLRNFLHNSKEAKSAWPIVISDKQIFQDYLKLMQNFLSGCEPAKEMMVNSKKKQNDKERNLLHSLITVAVKPKLDATTFQLIHLCMQSLALSPILRSAMQKTNIMLHIRDSLMNNKLDSIRQHSMLRFLVNFSHSAEGQASILKMSGFIDCLCNIHPSDPTVQADIFLLLLQLSFCKDTHPHIMLQGKFIDRIILIWKSMTEEITTKAYSVGLLWVILSQSAKFISHLDKKQAIQAVEEMQQYIKMKETEKLSPRYVQLINLMKRGTKELKGVVLRLIKIEFGVDPLREQHELRKGSTLRDYNMNNGFISSSYDVTRAILKRVLVEHRRQQKSAARSVRNRRFGILRITCKLWKEIVNGFTELLSHRDVFFAAERGYLESVRFLISLPVKLDKSPLRELYSKCTWKRPVSSLTRDIFEALLAHPHLDPSENDNWAIRKAISNLHPEIVEMLLAHPRIDIADDNRVFQEACWILSREESKMPRQTASILQMLLADPRVDPSANNNEAFRNAVSGGGYSISAALLADHRVDPSAGIDEAIQNARLTKGIAMVGILLADLRTDPTIRNNKAIRDACLHWDSTVAEMLLADPRVDPSVEDNEAIRNACSMGNAATVEMLLTDPRVDPAARDNEAFKRACSQGNFNIIQLLLLAPRVDLCIEDNKAIRDACSRGDIGMIEVLLADPRVDPSVEDNEAIRTVVRARNVEILRMLLANPRVDPSVRNNEMIVRACSQNRLDIIRALLEDSRVDPSVHNNEALRRAAERALVWVRQSKITRPSYGHVIRGTLVLSIASCSTPLVHTDSEIENAPINDRAVVQMSLFRPIYNKKHSKKQQLQTLFEVYISRFVNRHSTSVDGPVVEFPPATRETRVRFPVDARFCSSIREAMLDYRMITNGNSLSGCQPFRLNRPASSDEFFGDNSFEMYVGCNVALTSYKCLIKSAKPCVDRESNPGLPRGRRKFYHWTIDAC
ncbi:putative ankyrin repeat protein [Planoprotostelium fungivorum]|uniref:Putative ankyrin repeat protein n=1 Tax=Planoprotostelium fungivorum TaxID=1890364 RepID=A0A2P6NNT0_9EUKA|nr:putative ankyrin repeat protein [Planoprotostelium fungivorum]